MEERCPEIRDPKGDFWDFPVIDTHAHVSCDEFSQDREEVVRRALHSGIAFIEVGFDVESSRRSLSLAEDLGFFCAVGIHPHEAGNIKEVPQKWALVEALFDGPGGKRIKAIGEIGLDYYRDLSPRESQMAAFIAGLDVAEKHGLPTIIHQRDAQRDLLETIKREDPKTTLIFHCFSEDKVYAKKVLDMGGYIGIGGVITYPRNTDLRDFLVYAPKDRILLETDCPYLPPQSKRGKRNEPSFILETMECVASIWDIDITSVSRITRANALSALKIVPNDG